MNFKNILIFLILISFLSAKSVQFRLTDVKRNNQEYYLIITSQDLVLTSKNDGFFYSVTSENQKTFTFKEDITILNYTLRLDDQTQEGTINLNNNDSTILIDNKNLSTKNNEALKELSTTQVKKKEKNTYSKSLSSTVAKLVPGAGGDILRSVISFPGVVGDGGGGELYIRGSDRNDIFYAIDKIRIGNPFHDLGFYSAIPSFIINSLNFYPGAFPSIFSDTQGAVIQVISKDNNNFEAGKIEFESDISLVLAGFNLSIPISKNIRLSGGFRLSYYDLYLSLLDNLIGLENLGLSENTTISLNFSDYNSVFNWDINQNHQLKASLWGSTDGVTFYTITSTVTGTNEDPEIVSNQANIEFDDRWQTEAISYTFKTPNLVNELNLYHYGISNFFDFNLAGGASDRKQRRDYVTLRNDLEYTLFPFLELRAGGSYTYQTDTAVLNRHPEGKVLPTGDDFGLIFGGGPPRSRYTNEQQGGNSNDFVDLDGNFSPNGTNDLLDFIASIQQYSDELVETTVIPERNIIQGYTSLIYDFNSLVKLTLGLNLQYNDWSEKYDLDPRGDISLTLDPNNTFFLRGGKYSQLPSAFITPVIRGSDQLLEQQPHLETPFSYHASLGWNFKWQLYDFQTEFFYKDFQKQILANPTFDSAHEIFFNENNSEKNNPISVNKGGGNAYGLELFVKQQFSKRLFGWFSYTFSVTTRDRFAINSSNLDYLREIEAGPTVNNGNDYQNFEIERTPFDEDVNHNFKLIYSWQISPRWRIGINFNASSGKPYTPLVVTNIVSENRFDTVDGDYNSERYPWIFGLDFRVDWEVYKGKNLSSTVYLDIFDIHALLGILDVYRNVTGYSYSYDVLTDPEITANLRDGDPFPESGILETGSEILFPVLGFQIFY